MTRLGPLVTGSAKTGGALLALGSAQFVVAMVLVQWRYPGYTDLGNYISDLGGPSSPWAVVFNGSLVALGLIGILGTLLIRGAFPSKRLPRLGLGFLLLAEFAAILIGIFHETNDGDWQDRVHTIVSAVTFLSSGFALLFLGVGTFRDTRWDGYRGYTFLSGIFTLASIALFEVNPGNGLVGLWERLVVAPILLWAILAGQHLIRLPSFAPTRANV